jgi:hypothetical protein
MIFAKCLYVTPGELPRIVSNSTTLSDIYFFFRKKSEVMDIMTKVFGK